MLFKTIDKSEFKRLIDFLLADHEVIGPKQIGVNKDGGSIHQFLPVSTFEEIDWGYATTEFSAKTYFLPYRETLSSYQIREQDWTQTIEYRLKPRYMVGLHACDINALLRLDKVLARSTFPSPYYISRRRNTFIMGIDHEPLEDCFCRSVGADVVTQGFELYLTDLGDRYFVAINSDRGFNLLKRVKVRDVTETDNRAYLEVRRQHAQRQKPLNLHDIPNLLDIEFNSDVWRQWGEKCLNCGSCAMVCPTCYCYGVGEHVNMENTEAVKYRQLYSCNLKDFASVAGGHNFRPDPATRLKYRYYHQYRGFTETYESPLCVGCNRCGRVCLAGIHPAGILKDLQAEGGVA